MNDEARIEQARIAMKKIFAEYDPEIVFRAIEKLCTVVVDDNSKEIQEPIGLTQTDIEMCQQSLSGARRIRQMMINSAKIAEDCQIFL